MTYNSNLGAQDKISKYKGTPITQLAMADLYNSFKE